MLFFIIPLRSAQSAKSWEQVSKLLERTLRSILNQTSSDFRIIVVCHERPQLQRHYPQVEYLDVDFPAPTQDSPIAERRIDKHRKQWLGIHHVASFKDAHLMLLDSDDCINKNLVAFVAERPQVNGWYFSQGYQYQEGSRLIQYRKRLFEQFCGSCNVVQVRILLEHIKGIKFTEIDSSFLLHTQLPYILAAQQMPLEALPFPGAVYITDNSENTLNQVRTIRHQFAGNNLLKISQFYILRWCKPLRSQILTDSIREQFSLYSLNQLNDDRALVSKV